MTTIRTLMEQQKAAHSNETHRLMCDWCHQKWPCDDRDRAEDVLARLDESERCLCGCERVHLEDRMYRYVPDPGLVSS